MTTKHGALIYLIELRWKQRGKPEALADQLTDALQAAILLDSLGFDDLEDSVLNDFGQDIVKGDFVGQIVRSNRGVKKQVGVVLGFVTQGQVVKLRVAWFDSSSESSASEGVTDTEHLFKIDRASLPLIVVRPLLFAFERGRAKL